VSPHSSRYPINLRVSQLLLQDTPYPLYASTYLLKWPNPPKAPSLSKHLSPLFQKTSTSIASPATNSPTNTENLSFATRCEVVGPQLVVLGKLGTKEQVDALILSLGYVPLSLGDLEAGRTKRKRGWCQCGWIWTGVKGLLNCESNCTSLALCAS
jgi:hypothetical protein